MMHLIPLTEYPHELPKDRVWHRSDLKTVDNMVADTLFLTPSTNPDSHKARESLYIPVIWSVGAPQSDIDQAYVQAIEKLTRLFRAVREAQPAPLNKGRRIYGDELREWREIAAKGVPYLDAMGKQIGWRLENRAALKQGHAIVTVKPT